MSKNRRRRPTPRYRWFFYQQMTSTDVDEFGKPTISYVPKLSGFFALEKARNPIEIMDASSIVSEIQYVLSGAWVPQYEIIQSGMIAWCPATDKVMEILGEPLDAAGDHLRVVIYVADNVYREVDTSQLSTEYE